MGIINDDEVIDFFWQRAGSWEGFPRSLERSISVALPVILVKLPRLTLNDIERWLYRYKIRYVFSCQNRGVRGCLISYAGKGIIFIDGSDPVEEIRFTIAHEVAHFLVDYYLPRSQAIKKYGNQIAEVVDGVRPPNIDERIKAIISSIQFGINVDYMERRPGAADLPEVWRIEDRADQIALTLLAPRDDVLRSTEITQKQYSERRTHLYHILVDKYGLPNWVSIGYAAAILKSIGKGPSWAESFR